MIDIYDQYVFDYDRCPIFVSRCFLARKKFYCVAEHISKGWKEVNINGETNQREILIKQHLPIKSRIEYSKGVLD